MVLQISSVTDCPALETALQPLYQSLQLPVYYKLSSYILKRTYTNVFAPRSFLKRGFFAVLAHGWLGQSKRIKELFCDYPEN
jgi:hypothetical protein